MISNLVICELAKGRETVCWRLHAAMASTRDSDFLKNFWIPNYVLVPESEAESSSEIDGGDGPKCPVLVFVNSRSGGQLGGDLLRTYRALLNEKQVLLI